MKGPPAPIPGSVAAAIAPPRNGISAPEAPIVLIGFMGAGKSTVGALVAHRLGCPFLDLDREIERREEIPVDRIIREQGLATFRALESAAGRDLLCGRRAVVATGGGWAAWPGNLDRLEAGAVTIWLRVQAQTALDRIAPTVESRPLLEGTNPRARAEALLRERTPWYARAQIAVDTEDKSPEAVAREVLAGLGAETRNRNRRKTPQ